MKIRDNLYGYIWTNWMANNCNTYVINGQVPTIIDPGHSRFVHRLFPEMEQDGIKPENIKLVLITHCHPDHMEGASYFHERGAKVMLSQSEEDYAFQVGPAFFQMLGLEMPEIHIDEYIQPGDFSVGEHTLTAIHTPGHSPGSISFFWPQHKALFSGDVIFERSVGRTDFPGGDGLLLRQSIEKLSLLPAELILPGHGNYLTGAQAAAENFHYIRRTFFGYL
jgi:glyoxylase-like metal-dependent hydrolase (beta-lactamase superfamily II)